MAGLLSRLFARGKPQTIRCGVVVPAAGSSTRMGQDKLLLPLDGVPVIVRTLRALDNCPHVAEIVVVTRGDLIVPISNLCRDGAISKVKCIVEGGDTRTQSVQTGLKELSRSIDLVAIHDGARPLVSQALLDEVISRGKQCGAAAPAVPVKDTVKLVHEGMVERTPDRSRLYAIQTPQVFQRDLIRGALTKALEADAAFTDDCSAVERLGIGVALTQGDYCNLKLTTPEDVAMAEALLAWREEV